MSDYIEVESNSYEIDDELRVWYEGDMVGFVDMFIFEGEPVSFKEWLLLCEKRLGEE